MIEMDSNVFKQGAEAKLYRTEFLGKPAIIKERFVKQYRHEELDNRITKERIRTEAKSITRCKNAGIKVPAIYSVNFVTKCIIMEFIENSEIVSDYIEKNSHNKVEMDHLASEIGNVIGKMHTNDIIHGDLTTSNLLLKTDFVENRLILIDFGLSYVKSSDEDKGVDLYVLERAILNRHAGMEWVFERILETYATYKNNKKVIKKLEDIRKRGRKINFG